MTRLIVDATLPRERGPNRPVTEVAVGVLIRADGEFLLTSRPPGKAYDRLFYLVCDV